MRCIVAILVLVLLCSSTLLAGNGVGKAVPSKNVGAMNGPAVSLTENQRVASTAQPELTPERSATHSFFRALKSFVFVWFGWQVGSAPADGADEGEPLFDSGPTDDSSTREINLDDGGWDEMMR